MNKFFVSSDAEVDKAISTLGDAKVLGIDTETEGLNVWDNRLWCIQASDGENNILFPYNALSNESRNKLREYFKDKTLVAHNAKFDYKFLKLNGFDFNECYCTQDTDKILYQGRYFTWGLKDLLLRRFQIQMSKEARKDFYDGTFARAVEQFGDWGAWEQDLIDGGKLIDYALEDTAYLLDIKFQQEQEAKNFGMESLIKLENSIIKTVTDTEIRGVYLDREETKKFGDLVTRKRDILGLEIFTLLEKSWDDYWAKEFTRRMAIYDKWKLKHSEIVRKSNSMRDPLDKRKKTKEAIEMVSKSKSKCPFSSLPKVDNKFSPTSHAKLRPAISNLVGFEIPNTKKEWLEENIELHEAIATLVEFRKFEKLSQFCEMTEDINPDTGRIHGNFNKCGTESGRMSSSKPNLQQIPVRSEEAKQFRALFKPAQGYKFVQADYSGLELVIMAVASKEQKLIDAINNGDDLHCFTMSLMLECPYKVLVGLKDSEITYSEEFQTSRRKFESRFSMPDLIKISQTDATGWVNKFRDYVKILTYGMAYGLSEFGLMNKFHCSLPDAKSFMTLFYEAYPNLKRFLEVEGEMGFQRLYAVNPFGRRRYFTAPKQKTYAQIEAEQMKELDKQKRNWDSIEDDEWYDIMDKAIKQSKREFSGKINSIKRRSANFYPQSVNADMIKLAMYLFDKYFKGAGEEEGIILTIHDELIIEAKEENVQFASECLKKAMEKAGHYFLGDTVNMNVEVKVMDRWEK